MLLYEGVLYLVKNGEVLSTVDPESGRVLHQARVIGIRGKPRLLPETGLPALGAVQPFAEACAAPNPAGTD